MQYGKVGVSLSSLFFTLLLCLRITKVAAAVSASDLASVRVHRELKPAAGAAARRHSGVREVQEKTAALRSLLERRRQRRHWKAGGGQSRLQEPLFEAEASSPETFLEVGQNERQQNWIDWCQFRGLMGQSCTKRCESLDSDQSVFRCKKSGNLFEKGRSKHVWCVPLETRCDATKNCADGSDEEGCPAVCTADAVYEELYAQQECLPVLQGMGCVDKNLKNCAALTSDEICPCFNAIGESKLKACNLVLPTFAYTVSELATQQCVRHNSLVEHAECQNYLEKQKCFNDEGVESCNGLDYEGDVCPCLQVAGLPAFANHFSAQVGAFFIGADKTTADLADLTSRCLA